MTLAALATRMRCSSCGKKVAEVVHDRTITVTRCGRICMGPLKINLSQAFAGQTVGVREVSDHVWLISFMHYDLGGGNPWSSCVPRPATGWKRWRATARANTAFA